MMKCYSGGEDQEEEKPQIDWVRRDEPAEKQTAPSFPKPAASSEGKTQAGLCVCNSWIENIET